MSLQIPPERYTSSISKIESSSTAFVLVIRYNGCFFFPGFLSSLTRVLIPSTTEMKGRKATEESVITIDISPETKPVTVHIDLDGYITDVEEGSPLRPIFCLKNKDDIKIFERREECFILDFDPDEPFLPSAKNFDNGDSPDIAVIAEKGQVACRDYPHSRHLCVKHSFETTSHESYCKLCYCYVCDISAPCKKWSGQEGHCHAFDSEGWKQIRRATKQIGSHC